MLLFDAVLLEWSHKGQLVGRRLEATMSHLGRCVNELQVDLLQRRAASMHKERLTECKYALGRSNATTLKHNEVIIDLTVMREASHGGDRLISQIVLGGSVVLDQLQARIKIVITN